MRYNRWADRGQYHDFDYYKEEKSAEEYYRDRWWRRITWALMILYCGAFWWFMLIRPIVQLVRSLL